MSDDAKKVFLSYRRKKANYFARTIYADLADNGFDVFMDVENLDSGRFPQAILHQIEARPHFIIALTPGSLKRMVDEKDWLRRELEHALKRDRNIVPVLGQGFKFDDPAEKKALEKLPAALAGLSEFNAVPVYDEYIDHGLERLRTRFLKKKVTAPIIPTPSKDRDWLEDRTSLARWLITSKPGPIASTLSAPTLKLDAVQGSRAASRLVSGLGPSHKLTWTSVPGASDYVLERSFSEDFSKPFPAYEGDNTHHLEYALLGKMLLSRWYRVRAKALVGSDGPWSNVVRIDPSASPTVPRLDTPTLEIVAPGSSTPFAIPRSVGLLTGFVQLKWTSVVAALGYELEKSLDRTFAVPIRIYEGDETTASAFGSGFYRVRAKGTAILADSDWSEILEVK